MSRVPLHKREEVVQLSLKGYTQRNIANLTDCNVSTVNRIVQAYRDEGRIKDAPHKRRPRVTSMDQDLQVVAAVSEKPFLSAKDVRRTLDLANVSDSTIRRRLREAALRSRIAAQKPLLTCANKTARLKFAVDHRSWRVEDWKYVIFSDESTFSSRWDQQKRVWRMENTRFCPQNIKEVAASGRTSVNVWAAISRDGLSPLVRISGKFTSAAYCTLLEHEMIPYVLNGPHPDGCYLFQQDLSPVHTAKEVARILDERGVMRLEWCAKGADMNIIEHVWARMKANLSRLSLDLVTADELWEAMQEEWKRIQEDTSFIEALYRSLPERMEAVIQAGGAMTCY